ncbi:MAG: hypothetical protein V4689_01655 [Verrucomicrobiota bacterium]
MKTLLCLVALLFCMVRTEAANLYLNGKLEWNITEPQCGFRLKGELQNLGPLGTGTIKLVLWASEHPYPPTIPSPATGFIVGEYTLGALDAGYQFTDFTVKTASDVPFINGNFYFTIAVLELTTAGWRNQMLVPTGTKALLNGNFVTQETWTMPDKPVITPPLPIQIGDIITLSERATGEFNKFPSSWQETIKLTVDNATKMRYANDPRKAIVNYNSTVVKTSLKGKKVWTGKLVMTYGANNNISFKNTVYLYYQDKNTGTYKSVVKGYLFDGELAKATTWGTFKIKRAF